MSITAEHTVCTACGEVYVSTELAPGDPCPKKDCMGVLEKPT